MGRSGAFAEADGAGSGGGVMERLYVVTSPSGQTEIRSLTPEQAQLLLGVFMFEAARGWVARWRVEEFA